MGSIRFTANAELMREFFNLRLEAKTYKYGKKTIETGIRSILNNVRYRILLDEMESINQAAPETMSKIAHRFVASDRFDHTELSEMLRVGEKEITALLKQSASSAVAVFN